MWGLPSLDRDEFNERGLKKPRIQLLKIRHRDRANEEPITQLIIEREETYHYQENDNKIVFSL
jgi:hypothetical protein